MTRNLALVGVCLVLAVIESVVPLLLHLKTARADLLLCAVLYFSQDEDSVRGAFLSWTAGYLADLCAGTPLCMYASLALITFLSLRFVASALRIEGGLQVALIALGASLVHTALAGAMYRLSSHAEVGALSTVIGSALLTALFAPAVYAVLSRVDRKLTPRSGELRARGL